MQCNRNLGGDAEFHPLLANASKALEGFLGLHAARSTSRCRSASQLAVALNEDTGEIASAHFDAARPAGISDAETIEIIAIIALNIFTNLLNKATDVGIDFPKMALLDRSLRETA